MVIRIRKSKKNRQHNGQKLEDTNVITRIRKSKKKDRQHNGQKKTTKRNNGQLHKLKVKQHVPRQKEVNSGNPAPLMVPVVLLL